MKCEFCGREIKPGTGILYVTNDGKQHWFCSRKCEKFVTERKKRHYQVEWARKGRK